MVDKIQIINLPVFRWQEYKELRLESLREDQHAFGTSLERAKKDPDSLWQEILQNAQKEDKDILFFAEDQGKLIGLMGAIFNKSEKTKKKALIYGVYINKLYRGKGIGKKLLEKVLARLAAHSEIKKVELCVNKNQSAAVKLYESLGFVITGTDRESMGDGIEREVYLMEKKFLDRQVGET